MSCVFFYFVARLNSKKGSIYQCPLAKLSPQREFCIYKYSPLFQESTANYSWHGCQYQNLASMELQYCECPCRDNHFQIIMVLTHSTIGTKAGHSSLPLFYIRIVGSTAAHADVGYLGDRVNIRAQTGISTSLFRKYENPCLTIRINYGHPWLDICMHTF